MYELIIDKLSITLQIFPADFLKTGNPPFLPLFQDCKYIALHYSPSFTWVWGDHLKLGRLSKFSFGFHWTEHVWCQFMAVDWLLIMRHPKESVRNITRYGKLHLSLVAPNFSTKKNAKQPITATNINNLCHVWNLFWNLYNLAPINFTADNDVDDDVNVDEYLEL